MAANPAGGTARCCLCHPAPAPVAQPSGLTCTQASAPPQPPTPPADFDGSLPRSALRSILPPDLRQGPIDVSRSLPLGFRLIVAVNKADLLPKQVTAARLEVRAGPDWVRVGGGGVQLSESSPGQQVPEEAICLGTVRQQAQAWAAHQPWGPAAQEWLVGPQHAATP